VDLSIEELERHIDELRADMRRAAQAGDRVLVEELREELREAQANWEEALTQVAARTPAADGRPAATSVAPRARGEAIGRGVRGSLLPLREQVHHALTLLTVPAAPRLIVAVHQAFFGAVIPNSRLTSLRRDEERSFRAAPFARPYYLCPALTADRLGPSRGLLSISTWPIAERIVGPLSPRVHFLTAAIKVAEAIARTPEPRPEALRLLARFAANIPGGADGSGPGTVIEAARAELAIHEEADRITREEAGKRAGRLTDVQRLFGVRFEVVSVVEDAG
jgi:hypothetical protein